VVIIESVYLREYQLLLLLLRQARLEADLTQQQVAERTGWERTIVTKIETGDRRVDAIELRTYLKALGCDFESFIRKLEVEIRRQQ
jgi:transcriptional regulator with XRE-family HTH domain